MTILIASHNKHKIEEIKEILKDEPYNIISGDDIEDLPEVIEDRDTIEGNAIKKAMEIAEKTGYLTLADDTGLFVKALDGRPGVYSARYAGEVCSYKDNRDKMLGEMQDKDNRDAYFATVVAFASPQCLISTAEGKVEGEITEEEIGENGFGYDPIFRAKETGKTFGEMDEESKHEISHRGRAFRSILQALKDYFDEFEEE